LASQYGTQGFKGVFLSLFLRLSYALSVCGGSEASLQYDQCHPGLNKVRQALDYVLAELLLVNKPARSSISDEQTNVPGLDRFDIEQPILGVCTLIQDSQGNDKEAYKYKIAEPTESSGCLDDYAEYAFVVCECVDRNSEEVTLYIDIKLKGLYDILYMVLYGVKAISLVEDKLSIEQKFLFYFLSELDKYAENSNNSDYEFLCQYLRLLIDYLKQVYSAILQRLELILQYGYITYDLLWALFKPGSYVFITCFGTKEPWCVIFNAGEEIIQNDETWFNLKC
ncbi:hypothetical protein N7481_004892, partial [Penicillium waksmanii]|uniref:uncharacterized protein n=1 Tax=Penicillium waksmanii TaxID=69791 RepID=UPI0025468475